MDQAKLEEIKALQIKAAKEIVAALPSLDRDALSELIALEGDSNSPRDPVIKAIAARIEELDAEPEPAPRAAPKKADAPAPKAPEKTHYQHPEYAGPLTIEQAEWRNAHLKPVKAKDVKTK